MLAGRASAISDGDDLADLGQREADRLRGPDEAQPGQGLCVVGAVAGLGAPGGASRPACS